MSSPIVFHSLAALAYSLLALALWRRFAARQPTVQVGQMARVGLFVAIMLHGFALQNSILLDQRLQLSWALALSTAVWLGMIVFWLESLIIRIDGLQLLLLPAGALSCLLVALFPKEQMVAHAVDPAVRIHLLVALLAYGLVTISALQAILMSAIDRRLHFPLAAREAKGLRVVLGRILDAQPPLLAQEQVLFRVIWIAFALLTFAVISGSLISVAATGKWLPFDHKTVFTLLSWLTFGILLVGRYTRGWRGRIALRYTLLGFAFIVLSYTGSRFVVEVILQRS
jgi:ABC-type uncharacterized transport system permease subunit